MKYIAEPDTPGVPEQERFVSVIEIEQYAREQDLQTLLRMADLEIARHRDNLIRTLPIWKSGRLPEYQAAMDAFFASGGEGDWPVHEDYYDDPDTLPLVEKVLFRKQ
jgi:hypothetical protein